MPRITYSNEIVRLCSQFDHSEKFIVDCPYSTLCMKKTYSVNLTGNFTKGTHRDCAHQKYEYQKYVDGKWQLAVSIDEEPFMEGCLEADDKGFKISSATYCYCKGDLCNGSFSVRPSNIMKLTVIIAIFYSSLKH